MIFFFIFTLELLALFFLSRFVTRALSSLFYQITKQETWAVYLLAILFFPGTLVHELAHFFMAILLFVRVGDIEFIPKIHGDSVKLGSVQIGKTDPFRRALIGLAPMFVGVMCLLASIYYFSSFPFNPWFVNMLFLLVIVFEISNTMFSSKRDVEGLLPLVLVLSVFIASAYVGGLRLPDAAMQYLASEQVETLLKHMCLFMLIPLGMDALLVLLPKILHKR